MGDAFIETPEFFSIRQLFEKAYLGLSFHGQTKNIVAGKLASMHLLPHFEQLLNLLEIFEILASSKEVTELNDKDTTIKLFFDDKIRMGAVYKYIHAKYDKSPDVNDVAASVHLSTSAFCRYFKRQTKKTFSQFVNQVRITHATSLLQDKNKSIADVCYECGFNNLSYFNRQFKNFTNKSPLEYRKQYDR